MRKPTLAALAALALFSAACDTTTSPYCDTVPTRIVATSGDTIQTVSGLRYIDLEIGTGAEVRSCDLVSVDYVGSFTDGTRFDSGRIPDAVPGGGRLIPGFEQALVGMREGGRRRAIIPPNLGYGAGGTGGIPPNSTLIFDLEIITVAR